MRLRTAKNSLPSVDRTAHGKETDHGKEPEKRTAKESARQRGNAAHGKESVHGKAAKMRTAKKHRTAKKKRLCRDNTFAVSKACAHGKDAFAMRFCLCRAPCDIFFFSLYIVLILILIFIL